MSSVRNRCGRLDGNFHHTLGEMSDRDIAESANSRGSRVAKLGAKVADSNDLGCTLSHEPGLGPVQVLGGISNTNC